MINLHDISCPLAGFGPVNGEIKVGSVVKIAGENGIGKTLLIKIMSGMCGVYKGDIVVNGYSLRYNVEELRRCAHTIMAQNALYEDLTVLHNIALWSKRWSGVDLSEVAVRVFRLEECSRARVATLSSGFKRRVALSMLVARPCRIWFIDEADSYLDEEALALLKDLIRQRVSTDGIVIYTAHSDYLDDIKSDEICLKKPKITT